MILLSILTFILILMVVVFIHELGHFLAARKNGVLVEEFGIGMPPRAIGVQKIDAKWKIVHRFDRLITDPVIIAKIIAARKKGVHIEALGIGKNLPHALGVQRIHGVWYFHILVGSQSETNIAIVDPKVSDPTPISLIAIDPAVIAPGTIEQIIIDPAKTIYSFNWLPLGGFVRLYGDGAGGEGGEVNPQYKHLSLGSASVWGRFIIMIAGVVMNILLATVIYYALLGSRGFISDRLPLLDDVSFRFGKQIESVGAVAIRPGSPAAKAGIPSDSLIKGIRPAIACPTGTICNKDIGWQQISKTTDLIDLVKRNDGKPIEIELQKNMLNPELMYVVVTPEFDKKENRAMIGVQLMKYVSFDYSRTLTDRILSGPMHAYNLMSYNLQIQRVIFAASIKARDPRIAGDAMGGPVAIARVVGDTVNRSGSDTIRNLLSLTALISLSLAFMNILPIPALDGGRVALLIPEMITGRKINKKFESYINIGGFVFLIALSIVITFKDVLNLFR